MTIIYGLLGLSIIIFIHELGHFAVARLFGVKVESFSIGMGPVLLHKRIKDTDYRLSLIPFGGYCGMKGEKDFQKAIDEKLDYIRAEKDSFYGVHPLKRIGIAFAGPFANLVSAIIALSFVAMIGYEYYTSSNKIILATEVYPDSSRAAAQAGLRTGDKITAINGARIRYFSDIVETVALSAKKPLHIEVERNGGFINYTVIPELDKATGAGKIGIVSWTDPLIAHIVSEDSPASRAGLQSGDRIVQINGKNVYNTIDIYTQLKGVRNAHIRYERNGETISAQLTVPENTELTEKTPLIDGIQWQTEKVHSKTFSFFPAFIQGTKETFKLLGVTLQSIGLLFKGVDVKQAVSGPIGITVMLGETAKEGFSVGFFAGLVTVCNFLAVISISLFLMNLLPVPILDGGLIVFALVELIRKKSLKPQTLYKIQFIGIAFIAVIFMFGMFTDISRIIKHLQGQ
ncbi:RIP metalloprotease RseP [Treponema sp. OMZ 840]|uniref:RIP metalloprotease RseP n=1 Tax=Treponema sp. OMZ 840 TaxID=244313 RepID=UPI003D8E3EEF